jgi:predicted transcriptional regulator
MQDVKERLDKLRVDAEDCELISKLATNPAKRLAFEALAEQYQKMARDIESLIASGDIPGDLGI